MKILDNTTKQVTTDYSDLEKKVVSGQYSLEKGREISVLSPDGTRGTVPSENAVSAFKQGFTFISPEQIAREEKEREYGEGLEAELTAGALGAARGFTFGLSDQALTKLKVIKPEALKLYKDLNPDSSLAGEIGGVVIPSLLSGGTSLAARVSAKTLPALALKGSAKVGGLAAKGVTGKIASKTVSNIVENAVKAGVGSAVEGALYGSGKLLSEEAMGDAEFNAESLMAYAAEGALYGGAIGGSLPIIGALARKVGQPIKKGVDKGLLKVFGMTDEQANTIIQKEASDKALENSIEAVKKGNFKKIQEAGEKIGVKPTQGMLSEVPLVQQLESSLAQAPTLAGQQVRKEVTKVYEGIERAVKGVVNRVDDSILNGTPLTKFQAGDAIKQNLISDIGERANKASSFYDQLTDTFGKSEVSNRVKGQLKRRLKESDTYRVFKPKAIDDIIETIDRVGTVDDLAMFKSKIGSDMNVAWRSGDNNTYRYLSDVYETLTKMRERAIIENSGNSAEIIAGLKEANKVYSSIFKEFEPVREALKLSKIKSPRLLAESLDTIDSEKIAERFFAKKDFANNQILKELFPESFETARKVKLADIWNKSQTKGQLSVKKFTNNIKKLSKEESDLIFGADRKETLEAITELVDAMPDMVGPSGTAQALDLFNFFSVATQGRDLVRLALYRNGAEGLNKYLNETIGVFKQIEKSSNNTKKTISDSVDGFLKTGKSATTMAMLREGESASYEEAIKKLTEFSGDPDKTIEDIQSKNKIIFSNAPRTSEAVSGKTMQIYQFLNEKAPSSYDGVGYFNKYEPSKSAKYKFMRYYSYATNPYKVLKDMKAGYVSPEGVETIRTLYPKIYEEVHNEVTSRIGDSKNLSYSQKRGLYKMLSVIGEASLIPENLQMLQGNYQASQESANMQAAKKEELRMPGVDKMEVADRNRTKLEKTLSRS